MSEESVEDVEGDMDLLVTRANQYTKSIVPVAEENSTSTPKVNREKKTQRNSNLLKCKTHENDSKNWSTENSKCDICYNFETTNELKPKVLPRIGEVLSLVITRKLNIIGKHTNIYSDCATEIALQWITCNVYPMSVQMIERKLRSLHDEFRGIKKFVKKTDTYWTKCLEFLRKQKELFDIIGKSKCLIKQTLFLTNLYHYSYHSNNEMNIEFLLLPFVIIR